MVRVGVCGAAGRMGKTILEVCHDTDDVKIGAAIEHSESPMLGMDAGDVAGIGRQNVKIVDDISLVTEDFDVLIDFTFADATINNLKKCQAAGKRMVIGTTGLSDAQKSEIELAASDCALVFAPNMSIGVNLCFKLIELASQIIGEDTDIEITYKIKENISKEIEITTFNIILENLLTNAVKFTPLKKKIEI